MIGAASRVGEHPAMIPLPENLTVSMARLLRRVGGIAYPVPRDMPRLMDASWTLVGGALQGGAHPRKRQAPPPPNQPLSVNVPTLVMDRLPTAPDSISGTGAVYEPLIPE